MNDQEAELYRYCCSRCRISASIIYPPRYRGDRSFVCPGCDALAEVTERPEPPEPKDAVVISGFYERRRAQILAQTIANYHPPSKDST